MCWRPRSVLSRNNFSTFVVVLIVVYLPIVNICLVQASDPSVQGPTEGREEKPEVLVQFDQKDRLRLSRASKELGEKSKQTMAKF